MNLLAAAYEELEANVQQPLEEVTEAFRNINPSFSAEALDVNFDGKIDIAEYSTAILLSDALSRSRDIDLLLLTGAFSTTGSKRMTEYLKNEHIEKSRGVFMTLYERFGLEHALNRFKRLWNENQV